MLRSAATSREKSDGAAAAGAAGSGRRSRGVRTKCVTDAGVGADEDEDEAARWRVRGGESETEESLACTVRGEGGCTSTTGPAGGVGGYECSDAAVVKLVVLAVRLSIGVLSVRVVSESVECFVRLAGRGLGPAGGRFVRHANDNDASV